MNDRYFEIKVRVDDDFDVDNFINNFNIEGIEFIDKQRCGSKRYR